MDESYVGTRNEAGKKAAQVENMTNNKKNRTCDRFRLTQNCQRWARWQGNYVWKYTRLHSTTTVIESRKMMSVGLKQRREKMVTHRVNPDGHYYFCSRHTLFGHFVFFFICVKNRTNLSYKYRPTVGIFRLKQTHLNTKKHWQHCETRISKRENTNFGCWLWSRFFLTPMRREREKTNSNIFAEHRDMKQVFRVDTHWMI